MMEPAEVSKDSPNNMNVKRRSIKAKNLEEEVELILSQDECDDHAEVELPQTPSTSGDAQQQGGFKHGEATPRASEMASLKELLQTPRRSCRKSVKPAQDYDDIVTRSMRSLGRSAKKSLMTFDEEENEENMECLKVEEDSQPKWSKSVVGKSSTKRRKSRRNTTTAKGKKSKKEDGEMEANTVSADDSVSQRKLDWDCVNSKEISEDNFPANFEVEQVIEMAHQQIPAIDDKVANDHVILENARVIVDHVDTLSKQPLPTVQVRIVPEIVIESPKENEEVEEDQQNGKSLMEASEQQPEEIVDAQKEDISNVGDNGDLAKKEGEDIRLLQEDSEDIKDLPISVKERLETSGTKVKTTRNIININNEDEKESSSCSFGSYLKSNEINVTDLGLIPLNDDDEDVEEIADSNATTSALIAEAEEMPSLIILDDEEDEFPHSEDLAKECSGNTKLNETFEAVSEVKQEDNNKQRTSYEAVDNSLHSFLQNEAAAIVGDEENIEMDTLKMSEDEETPRKTSHNILAKNRTLLLTPKIPSNPSTPKHKAKPFKFPTPYRNKNVNREPTSSAKKLPMHHNNMGLALTTLEPREIVLRGIRKRSFSMCLGAPEPNYVAGGSAAKRQRPLKGPLATFKQQKAVNFYSPANQTTTIDDLDKIIEGSVRKDKNGKIIHQITNVTTRRKRSFSFDESMMSKSLISRIPRAAAVNTSSASVPTTASTSSSTSSLTKLSRTKLPNFAAIHQKNFQKMESLVDHVARKQERSQILINSATKIKSASAQKNVSINRSEKGSRLEKPKALKKIDMEGSSQLKVKPLYNSLATKSVAKAAKSALSKPPAKENNCTAEKSNLPHPRDLPHPRVFKYVNKHQQHLLNKQHLKPTQTINVMANTKSSSSTALKKQPQQQKPFNLSTQLVARPQAVKPAPTSSSSTSAATSTATTSTSATNVSSLSTQDKMASRLQRHMDLFKGRAPSARAGVASRKIDANIRGVRSNRRFELQMQHRKNLEN